MSRVAEEQGSAQAAAAEWFARVRLGTPTAQDRRAFEEWLSGGAGHARAYEEYERFWGVLGPMGSDQRVAVARDKILAQVGAQRVRRAQWRGAAVAAAVVLTVIAAFTASRSRLPSWLGGPETFATRMGQHSSLMLDDGSAVTLNTESELVPLYSAAERAVRLNRGQALFEVAKDPARPFVVYAGDRRIVALGTSFDVRITDADVRVTLVEGRIAVTAAKETDPPVTELSPGQQFVASRGGVQGTVRGADVTSVTSWSEGRLLFSDEPLGSAVAEVTRYSRTKVVLADPALAGLRVSGVFRTGQIGGFVSALEARFPVRVSDRSETRVLLVRR